MTVRSIDTVLDEKTGIPIPTIDIWKDEEAAIRYGIKKEGIDTGFRKTDPLQLVQEENLTDTLKTPTEIFNHKHLHSMDIGKYLIGGQNISADNLLLKPGIGEDTAKQKIVRQIYAELLDNDEGKYLFFSKDENKNRGYLRNIYVSIREIQKAFGCGTGELEVKSYKPKSGDRSNEVTVKDISPPATVEAGIKNLLNQMNSNFFNIWDFELCVDPFDSTNIKVIDKNLSLESGGSIPYTNFSPTSGQMGAPANGGIYKFPSFKMGSTVKSQNLSFKIPNAMALTAMYGSNRKLKSVSNDPQHDNSDLMTVFSNDTAEEYKDKYLDGMESTHRALGYGIGNDFQPVKNKIGSQGNNVNSKIVRDKGLIQMQPNATWGLIRVAKDVEPKTEPKSKVGQFFDTLFTNPFKDKEKALAEILSLNPKFEWWVEDGPPRVIETTLSHISLGDLAQPVDEAIARYYTFSKDTNSFSMMDEVAPLIRTAIRGSVANAKDRENFYQTDYIIPAELSLEIDGIEGLIPGDIIQTDYIQKKYNKSVKIGESDLGPFTYFQIFGLTHKIDSSGWTTEIQTKMRTNRYVLNRKAGDVINAIGSDLIDRSIDNAPINNTTLWNEATDIAIEAQTAAEEGIETDITVEEEITVQVDSDELTDEEAVEAAVAFGEPLEKSSRLELIQQASKGGDDAVSNGMVLQPPDLTGVNRKYEIAEGPGGETIYQQKTPDKNTGKREFYYYIDENNKGAGTKFIDGVKRLKDGRIVKIIGEVDSDKESVLKRDIQSSNNSSEIIVGSGENVIDSETSDRLDEMTLEELSDYMNTLQLPVW